MVTGHSFPVTSPRCDGGRTSLCVVGRCGYWAQKCPRSPRAAGWGAAREVGPLGWPVSEETPRGRPVGARGLRRRRCWGEHSPTRGRHHFRARRDASAVPVVGGRGRLPRVPWSAFELSPRRDEEGRQGLGRWQRGAGWERQLHPSGQPPGPAGRGPRVCWLGVGKGREVSPGGHRPLAVKPVQP